MQLADRFQKMISYCDELVLAPYMRERLKSQLNYFRIQALCDFDRRENEKIIAMNWEVFRRVHRAQLIIDHFRGHPDFWRPIADFIGDRSNALTPTPVAPKDKPLQPDEFFLSLCTEAKTKLPPGAQKDLVCLGLRYLADACRLKRHERDASYIKEVWRLIWPNLERAGLLKQFRENAVVRSRVQNFIANGFYYRDQDGNAKVEPLKKRGRKGDPDHDYSGKRGINPRFIDYGEPGNHGHCPLTPRQLGPFVVDHL